MELLDRIRDRSATVGIIGMGPAGVALAARFVASGFTVTGFGRDRAGQQGQGRSSGRQPVREHLTALFRNPRFRSTTELSAIREADCIMISAPAVSGGQRQPRVPSVLETGRMIAGHLRKNQLVLVESTVYPGTTDTGLRDVLEATGLRAGRDFFLAFSPERKEIQHGTGAPRIVGGYTKKCLAAAEALYTAVAEKTVPVSSIRVAEAAAMLRNVYRSVMEGAGVRFPESVQRTLRRDKHEQGFSSREHRKQAGLPERQKEDAASAPRPWPVLQEEFQERQDADTTAG